MFQGASESENAATGERPKSLADNPTQFRPRCELRAGSICNREDRRRQPGCPLVVSVKFSTLIHGRHEVKRDGAGARAVLAAPPAIPAPMIARPRLRAFVLARQHSAIATSRIAGTTSYTTSRRKSWTCALCFSAPLRGPSDRDKPKSAGRHRWRGARPVADGVFAGLAPSVAGLQPVD